MHIKTAGLQEDHFVSSIIISKGQPRLLVNGRVESLAMLLEIPLTSFDRAVRLQRSYLSLLHKLLLNPGAIIVSLA